MTDRPGTVQPGTVQPGPDGQLRCPWALSSPEYLGYHDAGVGPPVRSDQGIFERLCLEGFQSGLSWLTILRKRENFRAAFRGFDLAELAGYGPPDVDRLLSDPGIIRNRRKIEATIQNARAALAVPGGLAALVWSYAVDPAPVPPVSMADLPALHPGVHRAGQGPARPRLQIHRPGHGLRHLPGLRSGRRPFAGLLPARQARAGSPISLRESHRRCHNMSRAWLEGE